MKIKLLFLSFGLVAFSLAQSQPIKFQRLGGAPGVLDGEGGKPTSDGGYILIGNTDQGGSPPWDPISYVRRTDSLLNTIWVREYAKPGLSYSPSVLMENSDGGFFIGQQFNNGAAWDHACIIKINSNGDTLWAKRGGIAPTTMYQNSDGGYTLIEGQLMAKTDSNFTILWEKFYKGFTDIRPAQQTIDGGYVFCGDAGTGPAPNAVGLHVLKTDSLGVTQWSKTYSNSSGYIIAAYGNKTIEQTNDGGYIMIGTDSIDGQWREDAIVIKTDAMGNVQWSKTYGGTGYERGISIREVSGQVGYIFTSLSYGIESPQNSRRTTMVRINGNGNVLWGKMYGRVAANQYNTDDIAVGIDITADGGFIFSGSAQEAGTAFTDGWLVKTDANGVSGCNEISTFPLITTPTLIIGTGGTDSMILNPTQFIPEGTLVIGAWQLPDSVLCPLPSNPGVNEINLENMISLYPNPTGGAFQITSGELRITNIEVINVLGEQIQKLAIGSKQLVTNSPTIDLSSQPEGIYFVRVDTEKGIVSKKVVVLR